MKSYKLYLLYDLSAFGKNNILAMFVMAFFLQVLTNSIFFGFLFLMACVVIPVLLSYIFASLIFQDRKVTEYFFSLPLSRIQITLSGFFLTIVSGLAVLAFCFLLHISGFPDTVQQYLATRFGSDLYVTEPSLVDANILFRTCPQKCKELKMREMLIA